MSLFSNLLLLFLSISLICAVESAPATNDTKDLTHFQGSSTVPSTSEQTPNAKEDQLSSFREKLSSLLNNPNTALAAMKTMASVLNASKQLSSSSGQGQLSPTPVNKPTTPTESDEQMQGESMHNPELPTSARGC